jgi:predicted HTH transcriptional regulator
MKSPRQPALSHPGDRPAAAPDGPTRALLERVKLGEDSLLEFKSLRFRGGKVVEPDPRKLADELSAMANSVTGKFLLGVDDKTRELQPLSPVELDAAETWVRSICNDLISPRLSCVIRKLPVGGGKGILCVDVPKSLFVHKGASGYFTRLGSSKRELSPDMLARLFQQRSQTRLVCFDEQVVAGATMSDLSPDLYRRFKTALSDADDLSFLKKLHFVAVDADGTLRPTVGGLLMACERPDEFLPGAFIQAVAYRNTDRTAADQLDARDFFGPLDRQVLQSVDFVNRNMRIAAVKPLGRIDLPQFSLPAVFEALVNAVVHRDYSIHGSKIRLHMFADRLEIFSPGSLPNTLTLEEIAERQFSRNELVCSAMSRCPVPENARYVGRTSMMDRRGEGVPIILRESETLSGKRPEYRLLDGSELKLTFFSPQMPPSISQPELGERLPERLPEKLPEKATAILAALNQNPDLTIADLSSALGISSTAVKNHISRLRNRGLLARVGPDHGGHWEVLAL